MEKSAFRFWPLAISLFITLGIGAVAGIFTSPQIKEWYIYLQKPSFNPPNWVFAPVWTVLYIMIGVAAYLVWKHRSNTPDYIQAKRVYFIQLLFNFSWSIVFFGLHQVFIALIIVALLFISIVVNVGAFCRINKIAGWLLTPYLLWVSFAGVLNIYIYILNT